MPRTQRNVHRRHRGCQYRAERTAGAALGSPGAAPPLEGVIDVKAARLLNHGPDAAKGHIGRPADVSAGRYARRTGDRQRRRQRVKEIPDPAPSASIEVDIGHSGHGGDSTDGHRLPGGVCGHRP
jgi:hypothetical protein